MPDLVAIVKEPTAETYVALLQFALARHSLFSLVWRDQLDFNDSASAVAEALRPDLLRERRTSEWPGTQLVGHRAIVRLYRMSPAACSALAAAGGMYAWRAPERPEDLAFYVSEENPWLMSIAHERDTFVYPHAIDVQDLARSVPGLELERVGG